MGLKFECYHIYQSYVSLIHGLFEDCVYDYARKLARAIILSCESRNISSKIYGTAMRIQNSSSLISRLETKIVSQGTRRLRKGLVLTAYN